MSVVVFSSGQTKSVEPFRKEHIGLSRYEETEPGCIQLMEAVPSSSWCLHTNHSTRNTSSRDHGARSISTLFTLSRLSRTLASRQ